MRPVDIIIRKRDGKKLSREEIAGFLRGYLADAVADYQAAAFLMAIYLRGMDFEETATLTREMMRSGEVYDLGELGGRPVDKHSTGGVGDKVSLILAPLAAACGVTVPMVSGRGLGHTGGTLDKLESIPGFKVQLGEARYKAQLARLGVAMIGQSDNFVPADKRLYALRDVTGTVESIPLICASIMSKKAASGAKALVMDVKVGSGAFMQEMSDARELARDLIEVGKVLGLPVRALITDMNQPLGRMIGNSLEVIECIDCMKGAGPTDLRELTLELAAEMILLSGDGGGDSGSSAGSPDARADALRRATEALETGAAWSKFREMVKAQDGDIKAVDDPSQLDVAATIDEFTAPRDGFVTVMNCREIGNAACELGAGRLKTTDKIDPGVGMEMLIRIGDEVKKDQPIVKVYSRHGRGLKECELRILGAIGYGEKPTKQLLIRDRLS